MFVFVIRRFFSTIPIVLGVALLFFTLFNLVGGDPTYQVLGKHANEKQRTELRREWGYDLPKHEQFIFYLKQIATFDFGKSHATQQPIRDMIWRGIGPSLSLAIPAFFFGLLLAVSIALFVSFFHGRWPDKVVVIFCVAGMSITSLAFILFGQLVLAYRLGWFPISGYETSFPERIHHIAMPALIWIVVSLGADVRFFRTAILDEVGQDYVRTARAKGLSEVKIFLKHVLKNSLIPIITAVVIEIPFLILGSLLLENFFGIPGLGSIIIDAINNSDFPVLKAMTTVITLFYIFATFVSDVLYMVVDPKVRLN